MKTDHQDVLKLSLRDKMEHTPTTQYPAYIPSIEKQSMREEKVSQLQPSYKSSVTGSLPKSILYSPPLQHNELRNQIDDVRETSPFRTLSKSRSQSPSAVKSMSHMYFDANSMDDFESAVLDAYPPKVTPEISPYEAYRRLQATLPDVDKEATKSTVGSMSNNKLNPSLHIASLSTPLIEIKSLSTLQSRARATSDFRLQSMMQTSPLRRPQDESLISVDHQTKAALALKTDASKGNAVADMYEKVLVKYFAQTDSKGIN